VLPCSPVSSPFSSILIAVLTNNLAFCKIDWSGVSPSSAKLYDAHGILPAVCRKGMILISLGRSSL
jgi:hypothetical protein